MIDTHAHLQDDKFENVDEILNNALANGVKKIVCASASFSTSKKAVGLANKYDCVYATVGVHPEEAGEWCEEVKQQIEVLAKKNKVVAIGEIGLDYHYEFCTREQQKLAFEEQIDLAHKLQMPVVVHTRDASGDTMQILRANLDKLQNGVCIHCYSMSLEILQEILSYGFYISIGGVLTFKNAKAAIDVVKLCPMDRLMLETDCPYLAPEPYRGKLNQPAYVKHTMQKIAEIKNLPVEEIERETTKNAIKFFKF
ncbi:MAG: TatD family deoxyribonuclease [Clostridiales bacterium]|nr:TatD family deoxyribonuclease [Clostridiales bacterium]